MGRGFTRDDMEKWLPYQNRPEGSDARVKPSSVPAYWSVMADGERRLIPKNYVCTIFRRDDPVVPWLTSRLPRSSEIPWEEVTLPSWSTVDGPADRKIRQKTVPRLKLVGRLCAGMRYDPGTNTSTWNSYMQNGLTPLGGAVRIDVYIGTYRVRPEEDAIRRARKRVAARREASTRPAADDDGVLGVRIWKMEEITYLLISPYRDMAWTSSRMRAEDFSPLSTVSGESGIHAHRLPADLEEWLECGAGLEEHADRYVHGIVERFGAYVLGEFGWRAEEVQIKKLWARTPEEAAVLTSRYPDVEVVVLRKVEV